MMHQYNWEVHQWLTNKRFRFQKRSGWRNQEKMRYVDARSKYVSPDAEKYVKDFTFGSINTSIITISKFYIFT